MSHALLRDARVYGVLFRIDVELANGVRSEHCECGGRLHSARYRRKPRCGVDLERLDPDYAVRFRFCPKEAKVYRYTIRSNAPALDGRTGEITSAPLTPDLALRPDPNLPNWWTDDPSPALAEGVAPGARTVSQWREQFLRDFAERLEHCRTPKP